MRVHFNSFMLDIHKKIHELKNSVAARDYTSSKAQPFDPIPPVAETISDKTWLICFDEFQVSIHLFKEFLNICHIFFTFS